MIRNIPVANAKYPYEQHSARKVAYASYQYLFDYLLTWTVTIDIYMETIPKNLANEWLKETKNDCFSEILLFFKQNGNYPGDKN